MSIRALSVFAGLGGLDLGARAAGAEVSLATDIDQAALRLLAARDGVATLAGDLRDLVATGELRAAWSGKAPALLIGGPPCTAFSHAGFWLDRKRKGEDPAAGLLGAYVDVLRQFSPEAFVMENVPGLAFSTHRTFFDSFVNRTRRAGYSVTWSILNAASHGIAQRRRRLFVVGVRNGPPPILNLPARVPRGAGWALRGVRSQGEPDERPRGKYSHLLADVPPGENYLAFTAERGASHPLFKYRGRYWSFLLKLHPDLPSATLPAQRVTWNGPFHWTGRHLRVPELARLQGFPGDQPLVGTLPQLRRWIGNAVPPLLAAQVVSLTLGALGNPPVVCFDRLDDNEASFDDVTALLRGHCTQPPLPSSAFAFPLTSA